MNNNFQGTHFSVFILKDEKDNLCECQVEGLETNL